MECEAPQTVREAPQTLKARQICSECCDMRARILDYGSFYALRKCTSSSAKLPNQKHWDRLIELAKGKGGWGGTLDHCKWLVCQLATRLASRESLLVTMKTMLLTHDLIVLGDTQFSQVLGEIGDAFFDVNIPTEETHASSDSERQIYETAIFAFCAFVQGLSQFQLRFKPFGNLLDPGSEDLLLKLGSSNVDLSMDVLRDISASCIALSKFLVASQSAIPCGCFIFAEVANRYLRDACRLYRICTRAIHVHFLTMKRCSSAPGDQITSYIDVTRQYVRLTSQLNEFFDTLRSLPDSSAIDKMQIPPPLRHLPQRFIDGAMSRRRLVQEIDTMEVEDLRTVLARYDKSREQRKEERVVVVPPPPTDTLAPPHNVDQTMALGKEGSNATFHSPAGASDSDEGFASLDLATSDSFFQEDLQAAGAREVRVRPIDPERIEDDEGHAANNSPTHQLQSQDNKDGVTSLMSDLDAKQRFQVFDDQVLGKGGFGIVFKAWDEDEGRHLACKQITVATDNVNALKELFVEYRVLTTLQHPNIVSVVGFIVEGGRGRIFMEWVPSGSVQAVLQQTRKGLKESIVRRYIREALQGLAFLHSRNIVHRDLKPGNMLLSASGEVKLTDFGTSRALEGEVNTLNTGTVVGTVPYLSPESVHGFYSTASDIWAIGCSALQMATGRPPWSGETRDTVALLFKLGNLRDGGHLPRDLTSEESPLSAELKSFVGHALTFDRKKRPSAEELLRHPFIEANASF